MSLFNSEDHTLDRTSIANEKGNFSLSVAAGDYVLVISNTFFAKYIDSIEVRGKKMNLGILHLTPKSKTLPEITILDQAAIQIKGDTTEYTADSFQVDEYSNVDELLKVLPGLELGRNGQITAQGERVSNLLVDGEAFFSDNPAVVAKLLRASMIKSVQVFYKKSEQAEFTGIDDGKRIKSINLVLKEDAKRGYFGKIKIGGGLPDYFDNGGSFNSFMKRRKVAIFGNMSNAGETGNFGIPNSGNQPSAGGGFSGGMPKRWGGGFHYSNKLLEDALAISGNYRYNKNIVEGGGSKTTIYVLPDSRNQQFQHTKSFVNTQSHNADIAFEYKIDSTSYIRLNANFGYNAGTQEFSSTSTTENTLGKLVNAQDKNQKGTTNGQNTSVAAFYGKRFKKAGRTVSLNLQFNSGSDSRTEFLRSVNNYGPSIIDSIHQSKVSNAERFEFGSRLVYTEPLAKQAYLEVNYELSTSQDLSKELTYNVPDEPLSFENGNLDSNFSSNYQLQVFAHNIGANLKVNRNKWNLTAGMTLQSLSYDQIDYMGANNFQYSVLNFSPNIRLGYSNANKINVSFNYNGRSRQPTIDQLQPLARNSDPLNIYRGNPQLKQEFNHQFSINHNSYFSNFHGYLFANGGFNFIQNAISQSQSMDDLGRSIYQYVNVNGNYSFSGFVGYGQKIARWHMNANVKSGLTIFHSNNVVNELANQTLGKSYSFDVSINYYNDILNINNTSSISYTTSDNSVQDISTDNNNYFSYQQYLTVNLNLTKKLGFNTSFDWLLREKTDVSDRNNNIMRWNMSLTYSFLKDRSLKLRVSAHDLLNQNVGFRRTTNNNIIVSETFVTIPRYILMGISWNFNRSLAEN